MYFITDYIIIYSFIFILYIDSGYNSHCTRILILCILVIIVFYYIQQKKLIRDAIIIKVKKMFNMLQNEIGQGSI